MPLGIREILVLLGAVGGTGPLPLCRHPVTLQTTVVTGIFMRVLMSLKQVVKIVATFITVIGRRPMSRFTTSGRSIPFLSRLTRKTSRTISRLVTGLPAVKVINVVSSTVTGVLTHGTKVLKNMTTLSGTVSGIPTTTSRMAMRMVPALVINKTLIEHRENVA